MTKGQKRWMPPSTTRSKPTRIAVSDAVKTEVTTKANELIENVLKPKHIQPPPEELRFNYIVDIYGKWYQRYFYFCATYNSPGPNAISPGFESKFARMEYAGNNKFHLSFMRYTGQWVELYTDQSLDECLETIKDDPNFFP